MKTFGIAFVVASFIGMPTVTSAGTLSFVCQTILDPQPLPGDKNGNSVWIQDLTLIPGFAAREHSHSGTEYLVVERGTATVTIKGQAPKTLQVGAAIVIPANVPHHIANLSKTDALDVIGFKVGSKKSWYLNLDKRTQVACRPPVKP